MNALLMWTITDYLYENLLRKDWGFPVFVQSTNERDLT